ncbi:MAG: CoA pyrophosphatase [Saprospiraceae bacterium]
MQTFINNIRKSLQKELPGADAQYRMAHAVRHTYAPPPSNARRAAVLALLYPKQQEWFLALIQRQATNPNDPHSGQISFPGGKMELDDPSIEFTALREAEEEVGVMAQNVQVLGELSELFIPVSNFIVSPFVGHLDHAPTFRPQVTEVKRVLEIPFSALEDNSNIKLTKMKFGENIILQDVPYFDIDGHVIWGATAMILSELLETIGVVTR